MEEQKKKSFDFAADVAKQLIALATGIVTLTITFSKDVLGGVEDAHKGCLLWAWIAFLCSITFGVLTLMALTGNLGQEKTPEVEGKDSPKTSQSSTRPTLVTKKEAEKQRESDTKCPPCSINTSNVRFPAMLQCLAFIVGLILIVCHGFHSL